MYSIKSKWIENPIEENKKNGVELLQNSFPNLKKELALPLLEMVKSYSEQPYTTIANTLRFTDNFSPLIDDWNEGLRTDYDGVLIVHRKDQNHIAVPIRDEELSALMRLSNTEWFPICFDDLKKYEDLDVSNKE